MPTVKFDVRRGSFSGFELGPFVPVNVYVNASAYKDILENYMLSNLWQQVYIDMV